MLVFAQSQGSSNDTHLPGLYICAVFVICFSLHGICTAFHHHMSRQKEIKTDWSIKCSLNAFCCGLLARASVCLVIFGDFGGSEQSQTGLGRLLSPSGAWGGFSENTASHVWSSADSKSRSSPERFRAAASAPSSAGNAICHIPQAPGPPRRHTGSHTEKQMCMCSYNHAHNQAHADTHT